MSQLSILSILPYERRSVKPNKNIAICLYFQDGLHHPEVTMTIHIDGEPHVLDLRLNTDLVAGDHVLSYQKNGQTILHKPTIEVGHFSFNSFYRKQTALV